MRLETVVVKRVTVFTPVIFMVNECVVLMFSGVSAKLVMVMSKLKEVDGQNS